MELAADGRVPDRATVLRDRPPMTDPAAHPQAPEGRPALRYEDYYCVGVLMLWWILLIVVALVVIGWGVRRSRAGKAIHPDQSEINAARKRNEGRTGGYGDHGGGGGAAPPPGF